MRRIGVWISLLLLCGLLFGCGAQESPPATEPPEESQPAVLETEPAHREEAIYFANEAEFRRLYRLDRNTGEIAMILDKCCYNVIQQENLVYFISDNDIWAMDTQTRQCDLVQEAVSNYIVEGDCLLYSIYQDGYREALYWRELSTGREEKLCVADYLILAAEPGYAYFAARDYTAGKDAVYVLDMQSKEVSPIYRTASEQFIYGEVLLPMEDGVLFRISGPKKDLWIYAKRDGSGAETVWGMLEDSCEPFYASHEEILYIHHTYGAQERSQIRRMTALGQVTVLSQAEPGAYLWVYPLGKECWLMEHSVHEAWGPFNEYGYQENYSYRVAYFTLDTKNTITHIRALGELGSMFREGDFPILDSSTARKPVTAELYNLFVKNQGHEGAEPLCSTTHGAWLNIADGGADLALLAAPTPEEQDYLRQKGVEVEMKLYGGDGLVFIGNKENPVENISHAQLLAIYRGEITNWKELGGPNKPITVYYRDDQSGSQRLFEKLVWQDTDVPDFQALGFYIEDEMSSIVNIVRQEPWSIGYTIMTYLDDVYGEEAPRVFSIDGVVPSAETVADASYPYHTQGYLVIRADEPENSPARRLYDWFGCPVSDELLRQCGVTPLYEPQ